MAKVQIHDNPAETPSAETPSQAVIRAANEILTVNDALGRAIGIRRLAPVERLRMLKLIGGQNEHYMGMASLAFLVVGIDADPIAKPANDLQLEALIQRLGDDGIEAVANGALQHFRDAEPSKADLKNA